MKKLIYLTMIAGAITLTNEAQAQSGLRESMFSQALDGVYVTQIETLAGASQCRQYSWKNRGQAPAGYIKGVALGFARSLCRFKASSGKTGLSAILSAADTHNASKDALSHYQAIFASKQILTNVPGEESLRALFVLGMGLGMRESSGAYCEGWDTSAGSRRPSSAGEAGLFQISYDSIGASPELQKLYSEYMASPGKCFLNVFKEGASCRPQSILGTGAGAQFQVFNKACPAFAMEYAMTLLRILRTHFGPINRREAEVNVSCNGMLKSVQQLVDSNPNGACPELF